MIELKQGCHVPYPERLFEQYEMTDRVIHANVNASKVMDMMRRFIREHHEYLFFILELPTRQESESLTESGLIESFHTDVYFMDGLDEEHALKMLEAVGPLLVADGMNTFGFGGHESHEEILFDRYNVLRIYSKNTAQYTAFFSDFGITRTEQLITAWDTFDADHPGECVRIEINNKSIYDIPHDFRKYGLYFYERRGENDNRAITFDELMNKIMLVGLTYCSENGDRLEQHQIWGTVSRIEEDGIYLRLSDGKEFCTPPDVSVIKRAKAGEYKLDSTGEVLTHVDYTATWSIIYPTETNT